MPVQFSKLLNKKMTRKEFILHIGLLVLALSGIAGLLNTISDPNLINKNKKQKTGYGSGPYGV